MPTTDSRFVALCAFLSLVLASAVHAQSPAAPVTDGVRSSIVTVDELLKRENEELRARSKPVNTAAPASSVRVQPTAPSIGVTGVYGLGGDVKVNMTVDGHPADGLAIGSRVGPCTVSEIKGRCVSLVAQRGTRASFCPRVCWTGEVPAASQLSPVGAPMPGAVIPRPSPLPIPQALSN
jgi:hypothetical protein